MFIALLKNDYMADNLLKMKYILIVFISGGESEEGGT